MLCCPIIFFFFLLPCPRLSPYSHYNRLQSWRYLIKKREGHTLRAMHKQWKEKRREPAGTTYTHPLWLFLALGEYIAFLSLSLSLSLFLHFILYKTPLRSAYDIQQTQVLCIACVQARLFPRSLLVIYKWCFLNSLIFSMI